MNASYKIKENLKVSTSILYSRSSKNGNAFGQNDYTVFQRSAGQPPTSRLYNNNPDGTLSDTPNQGTNYGFGNPLYYKDKFIRKNLEQRLTSGVTLDWDIIKELRLTVKANYFTINNTFENFNKAYYSGSSYKTERKSSVESKRTEINQYTAYLNYKKNFLENNNITALLGTEYYHKSFFKFNAATQNSPTDFIHTMNAGSEAKGIPNSSFTENKTASLFGRLVYDYDMRYLINMSFRYDGSSRLGDNKYDFFPGVSAGWNMHNENFFKNWNYNHIVTKVKPRISYGVNGNIDVLSDFGVYGTYGGLKIYNGGTGYGNTSLPTLSLVWERSTTLDFGVDLGLFNNKVTILADYFIRDVKDKIADLTLPYWTGFGGIKTNNGILRNKGIEVEVKANVVDKSDFSVDLGATFYKVKNFVVELPENDNENNRQGGTRIYNPSKNEVEWVGGLQEGQRVGNNHVYAYEQIGLYRDQSQIDAHANRIDQKANIKDKRFLGDVIWNDRDKNDTIDFRDRVFIGRTTPDIMGGFNASLRYKRFNLYVKTDYALGHVIKNHQKEKGLAQTQGSLNSTTAVLDTWSKDNPNAKYARYVFVDPQKNHIRNNSMYWEKGDYLCLREITLSYTFNPNLFNNYIKGLRAYVTGSNLAYFTEYSGTNPEIGGVDYGRYPMPKTYVFGLSVTF